MRVNEIFLSISGECGKIRQGEWCLFLRLAKCNLSCAYCDTTYALGNDGATISPREVFESLLEKGLNIQTPNLLITGGEPLLQQDELPQLLHLLNPYTIVQIETNGTIVPNAGMIERVNCWVFDYKSTKLFKRELFDLAESYGRFKEFWFKFPIASEEDYQVAKREALPHELIRFAFSPISPAVSPNDLYQWIKRDRLTHVVLNCQIHKLLSLQERKA